VLRSVARLPPGLRLPWYGSRAIRLVHPTEAAVTPTRATSLSDIPRVLHCNQHLYALALPKQRDVARGTRQNPV
jgi:hypothetical protein